MVGIDDAGKKAVIGECKFRNEVLDKDVYDTLLSRRGLIDRRYEEVQYLFFSLSGFSKWVLENAREGKDKLITLKDMYEG